jgi:hypothetical protein
MNQHLNGEVHAMNINSAKPTQHVELQNLGWGSFLDSALEGIEGVGDAVGALSGAAGDIW